LISNKIHFSLPGPYSTKQEFASNEATNGSSTVTQGSTAQQASITKVIPTISTNVPLSIQNIGNGLMSVADNGLRVKFEVESQMNNGGFMTSIQVQKEGNKIMMYPKNSPQSYDYIQVFSKDPNDTLAEAITKTILKGYNSNDCPIGKAYGVSPNEYQSNFQSESIHYNPANTYKESGYPINGTNGSAIISAKGRIR